MGGHNNGLGLHNVYNFVTQVLKGDIKLQSKLGEGFKAVIQFPAYLQEV